MLDKLFKLSEHQTTVKTEVIAGLTTFLTMIYVIFVNPTVLSGTGMDAGAVFVATCLAAAIGCFVMGFWANYPIALAPGMGLNAFFSLTVVGQMGYSWETALGAVFISGICFFLLSIFRIREWIINSIPMSLKGGIGAGIGLFLGFIGLKNAGIVTDDTHTLVTIGDMSQWGPVMASLGFIIIATLYYRKVTGSVMIGILAITLLSLATGHVEFKGIASAPPSLAPTLAQLDIQGALSIGMISVIFSFLFVDLFDTSGTLIAVAQKGKLLNKDGKLPRLGRALMADSTATMAGSVLGTSTTTSYIESGAGIAAGGRTGLTAVVVGVLFLASLFLSPLAGTIPAYATAPALLFVAVLMTHSLVKIDWDDITEAAPVVIATVSMPLTFSITTGIAFGIISYTAIKALSGRFDQLNPALWVLSALFIAKMAFYG
ncbi:AGZA family xanthine/uracil permease-like MFS transporter [Marinobacterium halophilum]|uniref:AGZA family xanthine/uracil permease-like MFS transporter n=1 Tax=Marinobacterium halophilum TaxID=267374 RepID=A0A2P8F114_9GAMM|nr:NCS2 family permease [Marinobacterium halophilum]PSL15414.1 AGZA family xanthine/uracil permease-like MFS transporter [Marinobacterium halophilum]